MAAGRISLKIDSPFRDMLIVLRNVPKEASRQAMKHARNEAAPIWKQETAERAATRLQQRTLVSTARVGVTARNVSLRSATAGRLSSGTPVEDVKVVAEFGMDPNARIAYRRGGKTYTRRAGQQFGGRSPRGKVFHPAATQAASRVLSIIIQSTYRALYDALDEKR